MENDNEWVRGGGGLELLLFFCYFVFDDMYCQHVYHTTIAMYVGRAGGGGGVRKAWSSSVEHDGDEKRRRKQQRDGCVCVRIREAFHYTLVDACIISRSVVSSQVKAGDNLCCGMPGGVSPNPSITFFKF